MSATMYKSMSSKIVTCLKDNGRAANGSTNHKKNQNEPIKENVSPACLC